MNLQRREEIRFYANGLESSDGLCAEECKNAIFELLAHIDTLEQTAAERVIARGAAVKPHTFAEIVNQVRDIANQYAGTEQLRERIAYALTPHFERNGGPTPDYTGEGSAWMPPVDARAVVVPDPTAEDWWNMVLARHKQSGKVYRDAHEEGFRDAIAWIKRNSRISIAGRDTKCRSVSIPDLTEQDLHEYCDPDRKSRNAYSCGYRLASKRARDILVSRELWDGMVAAMDDALLPSARTKAIHMGEYSFTIMDSDGNGNEIPREINVPWITVKEIMRAIRSDALRANQGGAAT